MVLNREEFHLNGQYIDNNIAHHQQMKKIAREVLKFIGLKNRVVAKNEFTSLVGGYLNPGPEVVFGKALSKFK